VIDEPVEPVELDELEPLYWPGDPPEGMFGHFFVVAAFDELDELFEELLEVEELDLVEEVLTPDEELVTGSV
jgi:hypothetical protein